MVVRERSLSGEAPSWYVYRDGAWRPYTTGPWWHEAGLPRVLFSEDGWLVEASRTAADLMGFAAADLSTHHFTDFVVPGATDDSIALFDAVREGHELDATMLLRPLTGDVLAVDIHASREEKSLAAVFRLASDVDIPSDANPHADTPKLDFRPQTDVAFRAYVQKAVEQMPEPTPTGLELRVRRLYPHARVDADSGTWLVRRDRDDVADSEAKWWLEPDVARARYDAQALILEASDSARELFGRELVGHHWQEFVTAGSTEEVGLMLDILADLGAAESRFRLPMPDGALLEFDSYTEVSGDEFTSCYRVVPSGDGAS